MPTYHNPFGPVPSVDSLELGYDEDNGYFILSRSIAANVMLPLGNAMTAALVMKANGVRHFDYGPSITLMGHNALENFIRAAKDVGFEV